MRTYLEDLFKRNWKVVPSVQPGRWDVKASDDGYIDATFIDKADAKFRVWLYNVCDAFNYRLFTTEKGVDTRKMRVEFAIKMILTKNILVCGQRAFDNVFEMGDSIEVTKRILDRANKRPELKEALHDMGFLKRWVTLIERHTSSTQSPSTNKPVQEDSTKTVPSGQTGIASVGTSVTIMSDGNVLAHDGTYLGDLIDQPADEQPLLQWGGNS